MASNDNKIMTVLVHVLGIFIGFISPLIFLLASEDKTVKKHSKVALNWQLSVLIYSVIAGILMFIVIGFVLLPLIGLLNLVFCIIAAVRANEGKVWEYPLSIRFMKV